jgi:hypothetical protein
LSYRRVSKGKKFVGIATMACILGFIGSGLFLLLPTDTGNFSISYAIISDIMLFILIMYIVVTISTFVLKK